MATNHPSYQIFTVHNHASYLRGTPSPIPFHSIMFIGDKTSTTSNILYADFNQDATCISVGTKSGYKIYTCDPFGKCYGKSIEYLTVESGGIGRAEMLFCTSLVALVGAGEGSGSVFSPRKLQLRQSTICELTFSTAVLGVRLNKKRLVVVLEEHIYLYDISNMKLLHTIDTSPNPNGTDARDNLALSALSPSSDNCYLAYPSNASSALGELLIFDTLKLQAVNIIQAHKSPLSCVVFNYDGTIIASSSDKGTVIRVFSIPNGEQLYQFRRGTYTARILSIAFNHSSTMLCVSSDTDTVHIYKTKEPMLLSESRDSNNSILVPKRNTGYLDTITSPLASVAGAVGSFLPSNLTDIWDPQRDFAFAKIPSASSPALNKDRVNVCAFSPEKAHLYVLTSEGLFYSYSIDEEGGECVLIRTDSFLGPEEE